MTLKNKTADEYFLSSVDKIRPFLEQKAKEILKNDDGSKKFITKLVMLCTH